MKKWDQGSFQWHEKKRGEFYSQVPTHVILKGRYAGRLVLLVSKENMPLIVNLFRTLFCADFLAWFMQQSNILSITLLKLYIFTDTLWLCIERNWSLNSRASCTEVIYIVFHRKKKRPAREGSAYVIENGGKHDFPPSKNVGSETTMQLFFSLTRKTHHQWQQHKPR